MGSVLSIEGDRPTGVIAEMAQTERMDALAYEATLRDTVFPQAGGRAEFAAFLMVARKYGLNPITREIYAFPKKGGGIVPIVSIDGWCNLINSHPAFDGMDFEEQVDDAGELVSTTCRIYRKDRQHPIAVTEWLSECVRATEPWKMKHRMLRHKATIQCARYAFAFAGIYDEDEAERFSAPREVRDNGAPTPPTPPTIEHRADEQPKPPPPPSPPTKEGRPLDEDRIIGRLESRAADAQDDDDLANAWEETVSVDYPHMSAEGKQRADEIWRDKKAELHGG